MSCLSPRESAEFIVSNANNVTICSEGVLKVAKMISGSISNAEYDLNGWHSHPLHPKEVDQTAVDWIFLVDSLNFSFWTPEDAKYRVQFEGTSYTGYWALCATINRALVEGIPICSANFLSSVDSEKCKWVFRSDSGIEIPLLAERVRVMNEVGKILLQEFQGSFIKCVEQSQGSASKLLSLVVNEFPSFQDQAHFYGKKVSFYKRAQILIGDLWACFEGKGLGAFQDISTLTMFADYRVPQVLVYFGVLKYTEALMDSLKNEKLLENGCPEEVEIRGSTIWAIELICIELRNLGHEDLNAVLVDFYLWDFRRVHSQKLEEIPYHRTRSIFY